MAFIRNFIGGVRALFRKEQVESEMDEELRAYLDAAAKDKMHSGMNRQEALRAARVEMGSVEAVKDEIRSAGWESVVETFVQDLRYGLRQLCRNPGFTAVAVLILALGIGANTAIFSVVNAVLLRSLPYKEPHRLVEISENNRKNGQSGWAVAPANFRDWQQQNHVFESMAIFGVFPGQYNLAGEGQPEKVQGRRVSVSFFPLLGVHPILGRTFLPEEDGPGHRVVVLTYAFWQRRFGSDPSVVGRRISLSGESYTVVGVMPKGFQTLTKRYFEKQREHLWLSNPFKNDAPTERGAKRMAAIARLKPGVSLAQAQAEMDTIARHLEQAYPKTNNGWGVKVRPLFNEVTKKSRPALLLLMGATGLVLLIACVNVASLLLARGVTREREIAVRNALGASRRRLIRQLLTESVLLTTLGGGLGVLLAVATVPALVALSPAGVPRLDEARVDVMALVFTLAVSVLTGVLCGLVPTLESSKPDLNEALKEGSRGATTGLAKQRTQRLLVVGEIALALVLLSGAGLMIRSFLRLHSQDLGFDPQNVLMAQLSLPRSKYAELIQPTADAPPATASFKWWTVRPNMAALVRQIVERLEHLPGVESAGVVNFPPLGTGWGAQFGIEGVSPLPPDPEGWKPRPRARYKGIEGDYFQTVGIPLDDGRYFTRQEMETGAPVAIINRRLARNFFPRSAIGKHLRVSESYVEENKERLLEIVGVVGDVKNGWPSPKEWKTSKYTIYMPFNQQARTFVDWQIGFRLHTAFVVRTASNPAGLSAAMRQAIWEVDRDQPIDNLTTMRESVSEKDSQRRFYLVILGILAGAALLLATIGIYGVMSYSVSQRTHEIGVRRALGADPRDILKAVLAQGAVLSSYGLALGLVGALGLTGFLSSFLYGITPTDAGTFAGVALLLMAVALLACYFPARRATKVDPMVALRYE